MVVERDQRDAELDALITEALDVEVPAEFVAQVRARVATERARTPWPAAWTLASASALTVVAAVWFVSTDDAPLPSETTTPVAISRAPSVEVPPVVEAPPVIAPAGPAVQPQTMTPPARREARAVAPSVARVEPAVIVDTREAIALQRLVARMREGTFTPPAAPDADTGIVIQPITVAPLAFAADLQLEVVPGGPEDADRPQELEGLE